MPQVGRDEITGKLHSELFPRAEVGRDTFEQVLGAMAREGLVRFADAVFEKEGKQIPYRTVSLTREGFEVKDGAVDWRMKDTGRAAPKSERKRRASSPVKTAAKKTRSGGTRSRNADTAAGEPLTGMDARIEEALRRWRLAEAKRRGVPAFRIFSDRVLRVMATERPGSDSDLLGISGRGRENGPEVWDRNLPHYSRRLSLHGRLPVFWNRSFRYSESVPEARLSPKAHK